ncbi:DUF4352 domain-containing protein [Corynebacterium sp. NPDC060344]|uniref:DUF4352 domain-containing protein n=1 Tax=Corynebacterium sp. NPDC060344 TaxID=3347101 RepID=UPI0036501747
MKKSTIAAGLAALALSLAACDGTTDTAAAGAEANGGGEGAEQSGPAQVGDTVTVGDAEMTTSNFRNAGPDVFGDNQVCADVSVLNVSDSDTVSLNAMDWELTDPSGVILSTEFGGETNFDAVDLAPGGSRAGTVCFKSDGAPGEYTLTHEALFSFSGEPTEWKTSL